jgi:hypothetical protein
VTHLLELGSENLGGFILTALPVCTFNTLFIFTLAPLLIIAVGEWKSPLIVPDCNKVLLVYGLTNLAKMQEDSLDKMDPYQRGATDISKHHGSVFGSDFIPFFFFKEGRCLLS